MKHIHFIGIGGIGVSALVGIMHARGKTISGSDQEESPITQNLGKQGIKVHIGHGPANLFPKPDLVVHSLAIDDKNLELKEAKRLKIPTLTYPQAVGELTREYFTIAICGTHGKSTITAMISKVLIENEFDPTVIVGTKLKELGGQNFRTGKSKLLVLEACEYRRAFLNYSPKVIVLHTLDPDHLDYYKDFADYLSAFKEFTAKLPADGYFFGSFDDEDVNNIQHRLLENKFPNYNMFGYGTFSKSGNAYLEGNDVYKNGEKAGEMHLKIPGQHNRTNALAAFTICSQFGITPKAILKSLNNYSGAYRRFEKKGKLGHTVLIDDYGHHPAEIAATLQAAREEYKNERICVVYQPHQYNRTKNLLKEFGPAFKDADFVIIPNIFDARDSVEDKSAVSPEKLVEEIKQNGIHAIYGGGLEKTAEYLKKHAKEFDVVITMGAGDVWKIADELLF
ncbi:UDP-N-acetylmuramate--L-alanine ligase [Candidatus Peregrinibacteria bacterium]|nr:UDP-N-acetylmuramate--L-alanine ligase [Candidatus Peregrinibacteria bacterium]